MTRDDLIEKIECGSDIMFDVKEKHFTIITWADAGIYIDEQYPNDIRGETFESAEELVDHFMIDGNSLGELASEVVITDYS